ncbi:rolling circle replication-associated protein [Dysgonomonas sp.]
MLQYTKNQIEGKHGLKSYLWVAEHQKNETIHFHMLTNTFMHIKKVNHFMARAINTQVRKKENKGKINVNFDIKKYNGVDVRHVNNNRKALNCYLTKYVSKNTYHSLSCPIIQPRYKCRMCALLRVM